MLVTYLPRIGTFFCLSPCISAQRRGIECRKQDLEKSNEQDARWDGFSMNRQLLSERFACTVAPEIQARLSETQFSKVKSFELDLQRSRLSLVHEGCPCGSADELDDVIVSEVDRYGLSLTTVLCKNCGTLRTNPYLDSASLDAFYRETYLALYGWAPVMEDYFARQFSYGERVLALYDRELPANASVLEVGCGAGGALSIFQSRGFRVAGCDLGSDLINYGTIQGVGNLWNGTLHEAPKEVANQRYDLIYLHHVFEHMASPAETLHASINFQFRAEISCSSFTWGTNSITRWIAWTQSLVKRPSLPCAERLQRTL